MTQHALTIDNTLRNVCEVVETTDLTPDARFFDNGGDSLTSALPSLRLQEYFGATVDVFAIYATDDIAEIQRAAPESPSTTQPPVLGGTEAVQGQAR